MQAGRAAGDHEQGGEVKRLLLAVLLVATGAQAGKVQTKTDDFDGTQHVWVDEYGLRCQDALCFALGADWNSRRPDTVVLVVQFMGAYTDIKAMALNIDGVPVTLGAPNGRTDFGQAFVFTPMTYSAAQERAGRTSSRGFDIPRADFDRMLAAKTVKVRLIIEEGNIDGRLIDNGKPTTKAFRNFQDFAERLPKTAAQPVAPANGSTPPAQGNSWWSQQKPSQPAAPRYRCTDADGKPYVVNTPTSGCVVE